MKRERFFHFLRRSSVTGLSLFVLSFLVALGPTQIDAAVLEQTPELSFLHVEDEVEFVKKAYDYLTTLNRNTLSFKSEARVIVSEMFNFEGFCNLAIQDISEKMTVNEIYKFRTLFEKVFTANIAKKGLKFADKKLERVKYENLNEKENISTVTLKGKSEKGDVAIRFNLSHSLNGWKIVDLSVNKASLSRNYRGQFNRIFRVERYGGLMSRMERRLAALSEYAER